jgi:hypothetical protein
VSQDDSPGDDDSGGDDDPDDPALPPLPPVGLTEEERVLLARLDDGETIVVNKKRHSDLLAAEVKARDKLVNIDRKSAWGNPFIIDEDGDRGTVIAYYRDKYLPWKPSLLAQIPSLRGKVLACWCFPEPCHGDVLAELADQ